MVVAYVTLPIIGGVMIGGIVALTFIMKKASFGTLAQVGQKKIMDPDHWLKQMDETTINNTRMNSSQAINTSVESLFTSSGYEQ